jgi:hypothetical protein
MGRKQSQETVAGTTDAKTKPVRADLIPAAHKALRMKAAAAEMSMATLARKIISEHLGIKDHDARAAGGAK